MTFRTWGMAPKAWGATLDYDTMHLTPFNPVYWVVHHNGGPLWWIEDKRDEITYLQKVDDWHLAKGWQGIAYNAAIGVASGTLYRARHLNRSGAQWDVMNRKCYALLFTTGLGQGLPDLRVRRQFSRLVLEHPMDVITHQRANEIGNDPGTSCPGDLCRWVENQQWVEDFGMLTVGRRSPRVLSLRRRLVDLEYLRNLGPVGVRTYYGKNLRKVVRRYQQDHGLYVDGITGPQTYRSLVGLPITAAGEWVTTDDNRD